MSGLFTGVSALQSSQRALDTLGNNIANANTPGYHRQTVSLVNRLPDQIRGLSIGRGVDAIEIRRSRSNVIETAVTRQASDFGSIEARLNGLIRLESEIATGNSSPAALIGTLFDEFQSLSTRIEEEVVREEIASTGSLLTREINTLASQYASLYGDLRNDIETSVREINSFASQIADLNKQIRNIINRGINPNDLLDQRDQLVNNIADRLNARVIEQEPGQATVFANGIPVVINDRPIAIEADFDGNGDAIIRSVDTQTVLKVTGGSLQGQLALRNDIIPDMQKRLDELSTELVRQFDAVHATGVGTAGAFTQLKSRRVVNDITSKLDSAGLAFTPQSGSLFIGVTDTDTGTREVTEVVVDPESQQLGSVFPPTNIPSQSLADAISAVSGIQALANDQTGELLLIASTGFTFDFTGGFGSADLTGVTNAGANPTSTPTFGGVYSGPDNDTFTFTVLDPASGAPASVGITPGLQLQVNDSSGNVLTTLDIGSSYEVGTPIQVIDGITITMSPGNIDAGSTFALQVVANADTAGILVALGLNTFFEGDDAQTIGVHKDILEDPDRIATSRTRQVGDGTNLERLVALRDIRPLADGTQTFQEFTAQIISDIGIQVQEFTQLQETSELLVTRLEAERQGISGVDPNEELVDMIRFQQQFEVAARYISTIDQTLETLISII